jgi:hypothetical protein
MKQFLLLLGSSLFFTSTAYAQLGIRAGTNLLNFSKESTYNDASTSTTSRVGYQVGVYYQQLLTKRLSLVPEVQFSREQARVEVASFTNPQNYLRGDYRLHLSYLNVPVLLRLAFGPVYLEAGPQVSLLVGGRGQGQTEALIGGDVLSKRDIDQAATERFRRLDAGASLGVGVKLPAGSTETIPTKKMQFLIWEVKCTDRRCKPPSSISCQLVSSEVIFGIFYYLT